MDLFMFKAHTNQLSLHQPRPRKIKGGIREVRKQIHREGGVRTGNIWTYSMLGSQNAITAVPEAPTEKSQTELADEIAKKVIDDLKPKPTPPTPAPTPAPSPAPPAPEPLPEPKNPPPHKPPYDLSTEEGRRQLKELDDFYKDTYGAKASAVKRDEIKQDSEGFTLAMEAIRKINKEINAFNKDDARRWKEWANNILVKFGDEIIDILSAGAGLALQEFGISTKASGPIINEVKDILKQYKPTTPQDFVKSMKELRAKLLEGKPHWKAKYAQLVNADLQKITKKIEESTYADGEINPFEKPKSKKKSPSKA